MESVRWGILPVSKHFDLRVFQPLAATPQAEIAAVASRDAEKASNAAARYGVAKAYGSYDDLLADPRVEAVYISLPNDMHAEWSVRAMRAGKHVLCEKPFGLNASEVSATAAVARDTGKLLMEAFMYRFHPQWVHVKKLIERGEIGKIIATHCFFSFNLTDPDNIRNRMESGGGSLYDIGCYAVSSARWIMGREPHRVMSLLNRDASFGTDTVSSAILDFGSARSTFTVSTQAFSSQRVDILGSGGRISVELPFNAYNDVPMSVEITTGVGTRVYRSPVADQYGLMFAAVSEAIRTGIPAPTDIGDATANMRVLDALFASERSGGWSPVSQAGH
jgi:predicted dehydrogenase